MSDLTLSSKECILRALSAAEIGESCNEPLLRASFFSLAEHWLEAAEAAPRRGRAAALGPETDRGLNA